jgi:high-affinity Fe2+/Pb2+ permease
MYRLKSRRVPLGGWLILAAFILLLCILEQASNTNLLSNGITTQGVILSEGTDFCGHSSSQLATGGVESFSVQFSDQSGHEHTGIISQCEYSGFNATTGESVTIVYDPNDPTTFAPLNSLKAGAPLVPIFIILSGLITLVLLFFWIRKRRMRKALLHY